MLYELTLSQIVFGPNSSLQTPLPGDGKFSVIGSSISLSWRLRSTGLQAGHRGTLGIHHSALETSMQPQEPGLIQLPASQLEKVGAKCHSSEVGATTPASARGTAPGELLFLSMGNSRQNNHHGDITSCGTVCHSRCHHVPVWE